jgi:hypothetical protein
MAKRWDACTPRPGKDDKTYWHKVGSLFESDKGSMWLNLDSLPLPDKDGRLVVQMFEPKAKGDAPARGAKPQPSISEDMGGEEIPF